MLSQSPRVSITYSLNQQDRPKQEGIGMLFDVKLLFNMCSANAIILIQQKHGDCSVTSVRTFLMLYLDTLVVERKGRYWASHTDTAGWRGKFKMAAEWLTSQR